MREKFTFTPKIFLTVALLASGQHLLGQEPTSATSAEAAQLRGLVLTAKDVPSDLLPSGPPKKLPTKRGPAAFSAGYRTTKSSCAYYKVPNPLSARAGTLEKGTKIWLEGVDLEWTRGVHRNHSIFVPAKCLE